MIDTGESVAVRIADALAAVAYVGPFASEAIVQRAYAVHKKLEQLGVLHVTVIPVAWEEEDDTREVDRDKVTCMVAFQCRVESPLATQHIDELLRVFEVNVNSLRDWTGGPIVGVEVEAIDAKPEALWDLQDLNENSVLTSVASVTVEFARVRE